jgi:NAD(P)-dependent dehydrogenase (short-subunit alcohol dehydrogenase family)
VDGTDGRPLVCLVTGAARGFGRETSVELAARGHRVYATMREPDGRNAGAAAELAESCEVLGLDVTDDLSAERAVAEIQAREGRIAAVNNAGIAVWTPVEECSLNDLRRQLETNFFGAARITRLVAPRMREQGSGVIVQVTSVGGRATLPFYGPYCASKYALEALSEALALEIGHFGVRVVIIEPGGYDTSLVPEHVFDADGPYGRLSEQVQTGWAWPFGDTREVAIAIADAIEDPDTPLRVPVGADTEWFFAALQGGDAAYRRAVWNKFELSW